MERVAGIQTGGSERAFDLYMKARYLDEQHPGHGVTFATGTPISNTMVEMYTMQRFLDPEGLQKPRHRAFRRLGRHLRRGRRHHGNLARRRDAAAPQPLRQLRQPARAAADVPGLRRRADGDMLEPAPAAAGRRQADRRRLPDVGRAGRAPAGAGRPLRAAADAEGRSRGRTTPWPSPPTAASWPSTPGCSPPTAQDFPGSKINALVGQRRRHLAEDRRDARHADDLLRHGRESDALGLLASTTRSSTS